ncbi:hypothetical protein VNO78_00324 [Psophocarpus tetragonolobus]|uniref:Uncharacterized protein n=1 Tax=Psophocarpus tetragonolobus TaxID=3891 RepID=A0AAN9XU24_PSOTE
MSCHVVRSVSECFVKPLGQQKSGAKHAINTLGYCYAYPEWPAIQEFLESVIHPCNLDMTVSDILFPVDVPPVVDSFFYHHKAVNHDGHTMPLLSVKVAQLLDGLFIGVSMNHAIDDGTSLFNFINT